MKQDIKSLSALQMKAERLSRLKYDMLVPANELVFSCQAGIPSLKLEGKNYPLLDRAQRHTAELVQMPFRKADDNDIAKLYLKAIALIIVSRLRPFLRELSEIETYKLTKELTALNKIKAAEAKEEIIAAMNAEYTKQQQNASSIIAAKHKIKAGLDTRLENLYKLVENGICDPMTINRIKDLQAQIAGVNEEIKKASAPLTMLTPKEIDSLFKLLEQKISEDNIEAKEIMIATFVDKVTITNYAAELSLSLNYATLNLDNQDKNLPKIQFTTKLNVGVTK